MTLDRRMFLKTLPLVCAPVPVAEVAAAAPLASTTMPLLPSALAALDAIMELQAIWDRMLRQRYAELAGTTSNVR